MFVLQGNKRLAVEESSDSTSSSSCHRAGRRSEGRSLPLKARYGINAWKRWALSNSDQSEDTKVKDGAKPGEKKLMITSLGWSQDESPGLLLGWMFLMKCWFMFGNMSLCLLTALAACSHLFAARSKSNLLSLSSEELNVALSRFVREVCRPSGERYSPDSILYLCLGIQQVGTKPE